MMKRLSILVLFLFVVALLSAHGVAWVREFQADNDAVLAKREPQPGDDRGGHGGDDAVLARREPQPGDDRGGHGGDDRSLV